MCKINFFSGQLFTPRTQKILGQLCSFFLILGVIGVLAPFHPVMPEVTDSEKFAMNYALANGFIIGKDVLYTSGPYASIYSAQYYPTTEVKMFFGSLYLALSLCLSLFLLVRNTAWYWVLTLCLALAGLMYFKDSLLLSIPFCAGLAIFKSLSQEQSSKLIESKFSPIYIALLFFPFGLLPLTKGTMLLACSAISIFCAVMLAVNKQRCLAFVCLISPIVSMLFFWLIAGQSLEDLPIYFSSMHSTISGYTDAMSIVGQPFEVIRYLASVALLFISIWLQKNLRLKIFLIGLYFIFLFISFKGGFVRHDSHAVLSATSLLIATLLLPFVGVKSKFFLFTLAFSLSSIAYINGNSIRTTPESFLNNIVGTYRNVSQGILNGPDSAELLQQRYKAALEKIHSELEFPELMGTSDIYSHDQAYLLVTSNKWNPRPAFQSYTAYTPKLDELNRLHLESENAPDNIFLSIEPVDQRLPSSEDGSSWPLLLGKYQPIEYIKNYLLLKKKAIYAANHLKWGLDRVHKFGEDVPLPNSTTPLYIKIDIKSTAVGRLKNFLYKPNLVFIKLQMIDGSTKQFRLVPGMAKNGLMISPLIENTKEFGLLYSNGSLLDKKIVRSFVLLEDARFTRDWSNDYTVQLSESPR